jgi:hypothetical protein
MTSHLASVGATFSRASIGTYTDANGLVAEASAGQARPNYSTAGVHEGLLIEESRTNLYKLGQTAYLGISDDATLRQGGAYGSAYFVDVVVDNGVTITNGTGQGFDFQLNATTGDHSFSFIVKGGNGIDNIRVRRSTIGVDTVQVLTLDLTDGTLGTDTLGATVRDLGNNTYYVAFTDNANASSTVAGYWIKPDVGETCDGVNFFSLAGLQAEAGSFPTSYIPTIPTFSSRASTATFFNASGVLSTASTNVARIDHKYIDGQWVEAGLLLEGASTNLFTDSRPHNWSKNAGTSSSTTTSPISANTYSVLTHNGTNSDPYFSRVASIGSSLANRTFTFSAYIYSISGSTDIQMFMYDSSIGNVFSKSITLTTTPQLYTLTGTFPSNETDTSFTCRFDLAPSTAQSIGVFQAQAEEGSVATSRIPTTSAQVTRSADVYTTATVTRSADVCYIDGTAFTDFYNQEEGTVFVNFKQLPNVDVAGDIFQFSDGSFNNRIENFLDSDGHLNTRYAIDGSNFNATQYESFTPSNQNKLVNVFDGNTNEIYVNGTEVANNDSMTSTPNGLDRLNIGRNFNSSLVMNATYKKLIHFPRALQVTEIQKLTQ